MQIDLGKVTNVTGVFVQNALVYRERAAGLTASISLDGKTWTKVWTAPEVGAHWEFPVSTLSSGAYIPGRKARYLRLQVISKNPKNYLLLKQVDVYGKD